LSPSPLVRLHGDDLIHLIAARVGASRVTMPSGSVPLRTCRELRGAHSTRAKVRAFMVRSCVRSDAHRDLLSECSLPSPQV